MSRYTHLLLSTLILAPAVLIAQSAEAKYIQTGSGTMNVDDCTDTTVKINGSWSTMPFGATCHGIAAPNAGSANPVIYPKDKFNSPVDTFATSAHVQSWSGDGHSTQSSKTTKGVAFENGAEDSGQEKIKKHKRKPSKAGIRTTRIVRAAPPQDGNDGSNQGEQNKMMAHDTETTRQVPGSKYYKKGIASPSGNDAGDAISKANGPASDYTDDPTPDEMLSGHIFGRTFKKKSKERLKFLPIRVENDVSGSTDANIAAGGSVAAGDAISKANDPASDYTDDPTPDEMLSGHFLGRTFKKKNVEKTKFITRPAEEFGGAGTGDAISKVRDAENYEEFSNETTLASHIFGKSFKKNVDRPKVIMNRSGGIGEVSDDGTISAHRRLKSRDWKIHAFRTSGVAGIINYEAVKPDQPVYIECPLSGESGEISGLVLHKPRKSKRQGSRNTSCPTF